MVTRAQNVPPDDPRCAAKERAVKAGGGAEWLGPRMGITQQAISMWAIVPASRCLDLERLSGVSRFELRPDVYGSPDDGTFLGEPMMEVRYSLGSKALAEALGVSAIEMATWEKIPAELVLKIERLSGVTRYRLRPDVFGEGPEERAA